MSGSFSFRRCSSLASMDASSGWYARPSSLPARISAASFAAGDSATEIGRLGAIFSRAGVEGADAIPPAPPASISLSASFFFFCDFVFVATSSTVVFDPSAFFSLSRESSASKSPSPHTACSSSISTRRSLRTRSARAIASAASSFSSKPFLSSSAAAKRASSDSISPSRASSSRSNVSCVSFELRILALSFSKNASRSSLSVARDAVRDETSSPEPRGSSSVPTSSTAAATSSASVSFATRSASAFAAFAFASAASCFFSARAFSARSSASAVSASRRRASATFLASFSFSID
mmetsp:Transcript_11325/g.47497  ORF Transcript_11325/g.47497 Transcript_11325/m.47497 type:complete len:294 (-) Transcript_11325:777-1658(-)